MDENSVTSTNISEYLTGKLRLSVPSFQRNYSWSKDQVTDFWDDLISLIEDDQRDEHFFGQIITYAENGDDTQIIDGQQRLTTSFIFIGALKKALKRLEKESSKNISRAGNSQDFKDVKDTLDSIIFYKGENLFSRERRLRLHLQEDFNDNIAQKCLESFLGMDSGYTKGKSYQSESEENITSNFNTLFKKISSYVEDELIEKEIEKINKLIVNFIQHFQVVVINAKNKLNAFIIFETINTRGTSLTAADVIKSHLLSFSQNDNNFAKEWTHVSNELKNDSKNMTAFIRTYVWAKYDNPTERELFRVVSKNVNNYSTSQKFLEEMFELTSTYKMLANLNGNKMSSIKRLRSELNKYQEEDVKTNELVDILFSLYGMGESLHYPLMLSLKKQKLSINEILLIMSKMRSVVIRKNIISGKANSELTKKIAKIAQKIWNVPQGSAFGVNDIVNEIDKFKGDNKFIQSNFLSFMRQGGDKGKQYNTLAYLLFELYRYAEQDMFVESDKHNPDPVLFSDHFAKNNLKLVNIQNDDEKYRQNNDDGELIANWTVIENTILDDYGVKLKNSRILDKNIRIKALKRSDVLANKQLAFDLEGNGNVCDDDFIDKRQEELSKEVNEIWQ